MMLGQFTFVRMVATNVESVHYLIRIQRIRTRYRKLASDRSWFADAKPSRVDADDEATTALTTTGDTDTARTNRRGSPSSARDRSAAGVAAASGTTSTCATRFEGRRCRRRCPGDPEGAEHGPGV
jgi:hypothetical protein